MTENNPEPKKKRKYTRRKLRLVPRMSEPPALKPAVEFSGLTVDNCCKACSPAGCVISGTAICGHPGKGAQINRNDRDAVERLNRARKFLGIKAMEARYA